MSSDGQSAVFGKRREPHTVIIARGEDIRHFTLRPWLAGAAFSVFTAITLAYLGATSYLVLRDGLIGATEARQARMQRAYEDRISALRAQLDRITSRQMVDQQSVETKVSELLARQKVLAQRHNRIDEVLMDAGKLGMVASSGKTASASASDRASSSQQSAMDSLSRFASLWSTRKSLKGSGKAKGTDELLAAVDTSLGSIEQDQVNRVRRLSDRAWQTGDEIKQALQSAGLKIADNYGKGDEGGPLIPADPKDAFDSEVGDLGQALQRLDTIEASLHHYPLADPEPGEPVTSGFGIRKDPLLGIPALHPGIDFRSPVGKKVPATGAGTVTHAGWDGGYGQMVEIDHGNGYRTRYGHLSEVDVTVGEKVRLGQIIGESGSTGRSTGPHLHYEIRHDGKPIDPVGFLEAGQKIARLVPRT